MVDYEFLRIHTEAHVATVTMMRPPVNAANQAMYREIKAAFSAIEELAPDARAVILTGAGKHFCGGNDLEEFRTLTPENAVDRMAEVRAAFWAVRDSALPVVAAVRGVAVGAGVALAASADLVVAAEGARFGLPEVAVGVLGGAKHLSRLVPQGVVRRMHLTADLVPAAELLPFGGLAALVPVDGLDEAAKALASRIARHSQIALKLAKQSLNHIEYMDLKSGYEFEQGLTGRLSGYDDSKEALQAFLERRDPRYTGT